MAAASAGLVADLRRQGIDVEHDPPDILHLNDWHTATTLAALSAPPPTVLSIHNLA